MPKGTKLSDLSTWQWNKNGFSWGAQTVLNEIYSHLPQAELIRLQNWINNDLRAWADAPDDSELGRMNDPPGIPD